MTGSRELAMDATQEAFKRAFMRWRRLRRETWAGGWVMTTALNYCRRHAHSPLPVGDFSSPDHYENPPTGERVDLHRALAELPARQQQAAILHYLGDLPVAAVSELMGVSEGTVKTQLFRARKGLRALLEETDV